MHRFDCQHWLDEERGFLTATDINTAAKGWTEADTYICGPDPLMTLADETLGTLFGTGARILTERFVSPVDSVPIGTPNPASCAVQMQGPVAPNFTVILDGMEHSVPISVGETLLEAALTAGVDIPNSCTEGHCGSCMAQLRSGDVSMASTRALSKRNIKRGCVLTCQSRPSSSARILLDFDF